MKGSKICFQTQASETAKDSDSRGHNHGTTSLAQSTPERIWLQGGLPTRDPQPTRERHIGVYALTTKIAPWVREAIAKYKPTDDVLALVAPFAAEFHSAVEEERALSSGLHDLDAIELTYQCTLEIGAAVLLAASGTDDPIDLSIGAQLHASRAGGDDHFTSWGRLLTGLDCDPPIIVQFPFYLMMCQSFSFEPTGHREDYVYSALTGIDWVGSLSPGRPLSLPVPTTPVRRCAVFPESRPQSILLAIVVMIPAPTHEQLLLRKSPFANSSGANL